MERKNAFSVIKQQVPIEEVARYYGIMIDCRGKALCFAHTEKTPSLSFKNNRYYCFGCGVKGSVIDLTAAMENVSAADAAKKLDAQYALHLYRGERLTVKQALYSAQEAETRRKNRERLQRFDRWLEWARHVVAAYLSMLEDWKRDYAPQSPDDPWDPHFCEALSELNLWYHHYTLLLPGSRTVCAPDFEDKTCFYQDFKDKLVSIHERTQCYGGKTETIG